MGQSAGVSILVALAVSAGLADTPAPPAEGLVLWLRADAGVERQGDRIVAWEDQSGREHHAHAVPGVAPVWVAQGMGALAAVRFDGVGTSLAIPHHPDLNGGDGFSAFCVYQYSEGFRIIQKKSRSGGLTPDAWFIAPQHGAGVSGRFAASAFFLRNRPQVQSNVYDAQARTLRIFRDGELMETLRRVSPPGPNEDPVYIGKRDNPGATEGHLCGDLAEILIYSRALPDDQRQSVEAYLRAKYSVALPKKPSITITRVIPGHHQVSVDWLRADTDLPDRELRYELAVKLRETPWGSARVVTVESDRRSAAMSGLMNRADYTLRIRAVTNAGESVGESHERLVTPGPIPGVVISYLHTDDPVYAEWGRYIGSPSIARLDSGSLVASHDLFGGGSGNHSRVFRSDDGGRSWRHMAEVRPAFWGTLFVHRGELYLVACSRPSGDMMLHHSADGGATWGEPAVIAEGAFHKAPVPVVVHRGRLWVCVERCAGGWPAGFQAVALSAPVDSDLMNPENWTASDPLPYDPAWLPEGWKTPVKGQGFLEGNAVVDPQGGLLNILRYNTTPHYGKAVVTSVAEDGRSLAFDRIIDFYGGLTKFTIRRHPKSGVYWSLVNPVSIPSAPGMRSVLTLVRSEDLDHWTPVRDILRDDRNHAPRYTGFQYVDWLFDGPDIIAVSRTALNGAHNFHDANHLTFHRVKDYAGPPTDR